MARAIVASERTTSSGSLREMELSLPFSADLHFSYFSFCWKCSWMNVKKDTGLTLLNRSHMYHISLESRGLMHAICCVLHLPREGNINGWELHVSLVSCWRLLVTFESHHCNRAMISWYIYLMVIINNTGMPKKSDEMKKIYKDTIRMLTKSSFQVLSHRSSTPLLSQNSLPEGW